MVFHGSTIGPGKQRGFAWLPAAIAGVASLIGGKQRNKAASAQALRQMDFQERMSSTAHQREVKDLRAAGLNPILSATGGRGASSPGGAQAPVQDVLTPAVSSALGARRLEQEIKNLRATESFTRAQTKAIAPVGEFSEVVTDGVGSLRDLSRALGSSQGQLWLEETWKDITAIVNRTGHSAASAIREWASRGEAGLKTPGRVRARNPRTGEWISSDR